MSETRRERAPCTTVEDLLELDSMEIMKGYRAGFEGWPEPGDNSSDSYWHGWRNGAVDAGHREKDPAQAALAFDVMEKGLKGPDGKTLIGRRVRAVH